MTQSQHPRADSRQTRVLVIPIEYPLPANSGGRIDVWRRAQVLKSMGCRLALLTWYDLPREGKPSADWQTALAEVFDTQSLHAITRSPVELLGRVLNMPRFASHAAARWVATDKAEVLRWAREFRPDVLLLDGLYGAPLALWLAQTMNVRLVYRSHNIESVYMRRQFASASSFKRRLGIAANRIGLDSLERRVLRAARSVLDISRDDQAFWHREGFEHVHWLPPIVDAGFVGDMRSSPAGAAVWDLMYFGNLNTPNNVQAVSWLLHEVLPRLKALDLKVCLAGSKPCREVLQWAESDPRVEVVADPVRMASLIRSARVLVNPVFAVSGVNLKSVEMLFTDACLVSTRAGVQGLPPSVQSCFQLCDDPQEFALAVDAALAAPQTMDPRRAAARGLFESGAVEAVLRREVLGLIGERQP